MKVEPVGVHAMGHHPVFLDFLERLGEEVLCHVPERRETTTVLMEEIFINAAFFLRRLVQHRSLTFSSCISFISSTEAKDSPLYQCTFSFSVRNAERDSFSLTYRGSTTNC